MREPLFSLSGRWTRVSAAWERPCRPRFLEWCGVPPLPRPFFLKAISIQLGPTPFPGGVPNTPFPISPPSSYFFDFALPLLGLSSLLTFPPKGAEPVSFAALRAICGAKNWRQLQFRPPPIKPSNQPLRRSGLLNVFCDSFLGKDVISS